MSHSDVNSSALATASSESLRARSFCTGCGQSVGAQDHFCASCGNPAAARAHVDALSTERWQALDAARLHLGAGSPAAAARALEALRDDYAELPLYHAYLGLAYLRMARIDEARASLDEAVRLQPDSFTARVAYAELHARLGYFDRAVSELDRALAGHAPIEARQGALEFRRFCSDRAKDLYYRQTSLPRVPSSLRFWGRAGPRNASSKPAADESRSTRA